MTFMCGLNNFKVFPGWIFSTALPARSTWTATNYFGNLHPKSIQDILYNKASSFQYEIDLNHSILSEKMLSGFINAHQATCMIVHEPFQHSSLLASSGTVYSVRNVVVMSSKAFMYHRPTFSLSYSNCWNSVTPTVSLKQWQCLRFSGADRCSNLMNRTIPDQTM